MKIIIITYVSDNFNKHKPCKLKHGVQCIAPTLKESVVLAEVRTIIIIFGRTTSQLRSSPMRAHSYQIRGLLLNVTCIY